MITMYKYLMYSIIMMSLLVSCSKQKNILERSPYPEEISLKINRGLVWFNAKGTNCLSWRKLPKDSNEYSIWRNEINTENIQVVGVTKSTFFKDIKMKKNTNYTYCISCGTQPSLSKFQEISQNATTYKGFNALSFDLKYNYKQARIVTGDLTGDGELELIICSSNNVDVDPYKKAWSESTDEIKISAFLRNGDLLWTLGLGKGIESGTFYSPVVVWDIDADGKSEVLLKTNKSDDPLNYSEEYLTILNGKTGKVINETRWPLPKTRNSNDKIYNSNSRNYIAVAHLDGKTPTIIAARGTYYAQVLDAFDSSLKKLWERVIGNDIEHVINNQYLRKVWDLFFDSNDKYRGSHSLPIADIDENGSEEIMWGHHCITFDGKDLWKIKEKIPFTGHLDIVYSADIIAERPGKETYYCREGWLGPKDNIGMMLVDKDGKTIWGKWGYTHVDGGWAAKVIPNNDDECQFFGYDVKKKNWKTGSKRTFVNPSQHLFDSSGNFILHPDSSWIRSFPVDWEGDGIKEICTEDGVLKRYNNEVLAAELGNGNNYSIKWAGDLFGDHREELVVAPQDTKIYIVFNTDTLGVDSKITKLADRQYKNDLSRTAMQYNVIPTESGYIPLLENNN